jgi:hypothetical protein
MPIDWANVDWLYVALLAVFVFFASLVGNLVAFGRRGIGALLSALLFAAIFVFWSYYPHHLPLPTALAPQKPMAATPAPAAAPPAKPAAPAAPAVPSPPRNPVTDITPH